MVGKLTRYELKKSILNKFFLIIFCLFLALNVVLTGGLLDYLDLLESIATGPMAEAAAEDGGPSIWDYLSDAQENGDYMRQTYGPLADMTPEERTEFETAMVEKYGSDVFSPSFIPTAEMMTGPDYFGTDFGDFTYIGNYASLLQKNLDNQAAWDTAVNAAKAYGRDALAAGDNYGIRRNLQIIRLYSTPREEITSRTYNWEEYPQPCCWSFCWCCWPAPGASPGSGTGRRGCCCTRRKTGRGKPCWPNIWPAPSRRRD